MFKAKLIEDKAFYKYRRKQLFFLFLPAIPITFLVNLFYFPVWLIAIAIVLYIIVFILMIRNHKAFTKTFGNKRIEIDDGVIMIKNKAGEIDEFIKIQNKDNIYLKNEYGLPQETVKDIYKELKGDQKQNSIIVEQNNKRLQFDFDIDSYYMLKQLQNAIDNWSAKGFQIKKED